MASCGYAVQRRLWPAVALQSSAGSGLLVHEVFVITHDKPQSGRLLWASDQLVAEIFFPFPYNNYW
jgi:hypothetical protein